MPSVFADTLLRCAEQELYRPPPSTPLRET
ncbi:hypothetical protein HDA31_001386 [Micromonospora carbonacea subsp. aurantiaca]|nr:hypothetical protein [Micromonospora carbonacea]